MALLANCHRAAGQAEVKPSELNPFETETELPRVGVEYLQGVLLARGKDQR